MLVARSAPECHLYLDLNPCRCGEAEFEPRHWLEQEGDDLVARYEGRCPGCGTSRSFSFVLDPELPPAPPAYGGETPSRIIDPGQFLLVSEQLARHVPADPSELPESEREAAYELLAVAVAALEEVLKFIPPEAESVPEEAFTAPEGWMLYRDEPGRFRRGRLEAVAASYREGLAAFDG